jgi:hypothetical protein
VRDEHRHGHLIQCPDQLENLRLIVAPRRRRLAGDQQAAVRQRHRDHHASAPPDTDADSATNVSQSVCAPYDMRLARAAAKPIFWCSWIDSAICSPTGKTVQRRHRFRKITRSPRCGSCIVAASHARSDAMPRGGVNSSLPDVMRPPPCSTSR